MSKNLLIIIKIDLLWESKPTYYSKLKTIVLMKLYHGTSSLNAISILKNGFDFNKVGSNYGITYGKGIYFTPNYETARFYAGENGIILSMDVSITPYYLVKDISPNSKKKIKLPRDQDYNCIVSPNKDEYLILYFK